MLPGIARTCHDCLRNNITAAETERSLYTTSAACVSGQYGGDNVVGLMCGELCKASDVQIYSHSEDEVGLNYYAHISVCVDFVVHANGADCCRVPRREFSDMLTVESL